MIPLIDTSVYENSRIPSIRFQFQLWLKKYDYDIFSR